MWIVSQRETSFFAIELNPKSRGAFSCSDAKTIDLAHLSGKQDVIAVVDINPFHYSLERITKGPPEAVRAQLMERVERLGVFAKPTQIFYRINFAEGMNVDCSVFAVDELALSAITNQFGVHRIGLQGIIHRAIAAAYLALSYKFDESTLSVYGNEKSCYLIVTDSSGIRQMRLVRFDEFMGLSEETLREEIELMKAQYSRLTGSNIAKIMALGSTIRKILHDAETPRVLANYPQVPEEKLLEYPELFGAILVPHEFNMLPPTWINWNRHLKWAKKAASVMTALSLINVATWGYLRTQENGIRKETSIRAVNLKTRAAELQAKIPSEKLKFVDTYNQYLQSSRRELRMDEFMAWIANVIPPGFKVIKLTVTKGSPQPTSGTPVVAGTGPAPSTPQLTVGFNVSLSVGAVTSFDEAHRVFKQVLESLHARYAVSGSTFRFNDRESSAECAFELKP